MPCAGTKQLMDPIGQIAISPSCRNRGQRYASGQHPRHFRRAEGSRARTAQSLLPLAKLNNELIITHGNGPVVGKILMRQALTRDRIPPMSLDICVAHSQGGIAYLLMQALENALREVDNPRHVACLLTQVEVDPNDPGFTNPTNPFGPFFTEEQAAELGRRAWMADETQDSGRGWRHVVPSPKPKHIVDHFAHPRRSPARDGGNRRRRRRHPGGARTERHPHGVAAVIDKDLTSAHMANVLGIRTC